MLCMSDEMAHTNRRNEIHTSSYLYTHHIPALTAASLLQPLIPVHIPPGSLFRSTHAPFRNALWSRREMAQARTPRQSVRSKAQFSS
jgi:hypothetical protein